ncbi:MAG: hypothetical protein OCD00_00815 [Colwellia sp.]
MKQLIRSIILIFICCGSLSALAAESKSAYNINYAKFTYNQILTDFMYGIEPKLITFYDSLKLTEKEKIWALEGISLGLASNHMFKNLVEDIEATDPEATFVFTKLPKKYYSNLHLLAEHFQLKKQYKDKYGVELTKEEGEKSLRLYKALFGKEYSKK